MSSNLKIIIRFFLFLLQWLISWCTTVGINGTENNIYLNVTHPRRDSLARLEGMSKPYDYLTILTIRGVLKNYKYNHKNIFYCGDGNWYNQKKKKVNK
jgi:hypothetical protein